MATLMDNRFVSPFQWKDAKREKVVFLFDWVYLGIANFYS